LIHVVEANKLSVINLPTAYWNQCAKMWAEQENPSTVRLVIIGGDLMSTDSLEHWQKSPLAQARLLNAYGPTEATITATLFDVPKNYSDVLNEGAIPIGRRVLNRLVYILDPHGQPVPVGVPGELCLGGFALARGYLHRPHLTAERFMPNPFSKNGERLYRTGDLVRYNNRGEIEFLGRVDQQVKIRGYRIELGEIEAHLKTFAGIQNAVVQALAVGPAEKTLVAYYTVEDGAEPTINQLRDSLSEHLPDYMIPGAFMQLDDFPLTPSGKIDRKALPEPDQLRPRVETEYVAPRSDTEKRLADIMADVLKIEQVGVRDSFFDLGGHSMLGTQIISQLREEFDVELPLRVLFENPTVEGIALAIAEEQASHVDENDLAAMLSELDELSDDDLQKLLNDE
jgi:acyl-CoA synthetase (AMP-forming)/AMP-acid ligase II/acyl carrier protein